MDYVWLTVQLTNWLEDSSWWSVSLGGANKMVHGKIKEKRGAGVLALSLFLRFSLRGFSTLPTSLDTWKRLIEVVQFPLTIWRPTFLVITKTSGSRLIKTKTKKSCCKDLNNSIWQELSPRSHRARARRKITRSKEIKVCGLTTPWLEKILRVSRKNYSLPIIFFCRSKQTEKAGHGVVGQTTSSLWIGYLVEGRGETG